jgi:site-specific DNA recombinase
MRAAIYARRSTEEHQAASLEVQISEATRFIERKGWFLDPKLVFIDDAVSRAEFVKRKGLIALLRAVEDRRVDVVVTRDETRLGGDMTRTNLLISDIIEGGARIFYHFTDEEVLLDCAVDKFMIAARNFAAELEREKTAQRTYEHLLSKARRGYVAGGSVFGYDNIRVDGHVERRINESQADIVRDIFRRYADGEGLRGIAASLNERGVASPRAGKRGTGSWAPGSLQPMLRRELYHGVIVWNRYEKMYRGGTKVRIERPREEWLRVEAPELKIIDDDIWNVVASRVRSREGSCGKSGQRGRPARYLLVGNARCAICGGPMMVTHGKQGKTTIKTYACAYHRDRGTAVCPNTLRRPMEEIDAAVASWLRENVLTEDVVLATLRELRKRLAKLADAGESDLPALKTEAAGLDKQLSRLADALADSDEKPETIMKAISKREKRLRGVRARIDALRTAPSVIDMEVRRLEREARSRLTQMQELLDLNPTKARQVIEAVLAEPLTFTPIETTDGKRYEIKGLTSFSALFRGHFQKVASPAGRNPKGHFGWTSRRRKYSFESRWVGRDETSRLALGEASSFDRGLNKSPSSRAA